MNLCYWDGIWAIQCVCVLFHAGQIMQDLDHRTKDNSSCPSKEWVAKDFRIYSSGCSIFPVPQKEGPTTHDIQEMINRAYTNPNDCSLIMETAVSEQKPLTNNTLTNDTLSRENDPEFKERMQVCHVVYYMYSHPNKEKRPFYVHRKLQMVSLICWTSKIQLVMIYCLKYQPSTEDNSGFPLHD